jgi:phage gp29-like protein
MNTNSKAENKAENKIHKVGGAHFRIKEIVKQQSEDNAQVAQLRTEFAEHPSAGLTPAKLASILREAEHGNLMSQADLGDDMEEKDAHIFAELAKRKSVLLTVPWSIEPPRNASEAEKKDAQMIEEIIRDGNFINDTIFDMADGILKGFSNIEMSWRRRDNLWVPEKIEHRPQRWFMVNPDNQNELRLRDQSHNGAELRRFNWIQHQHKAKSGYIARANLIRVLAWPYLFKNFSVRDLAEFLEIYGLPARVGKYPTGAGPEEKASLLQAIMSIGHNAGGIIPKGMEIEFANAAQGQADPFELMISWCERSQSKAILGSTLTSQADGKSSTNALGNVHNEGRIELRDSDCNQIANTLTSDLVFPLYALNGLSFTDERRLPRFKFKTETPEDIKLFADALPKLVDYGFRVPLAWAQERVQIPVAEKDEAILTAPGQQKTLDSNSDSEQAPKTKLEPEVKPEAKPEAKQKPNADLKASLNMAITALKAIDDVDPVAQQTQQLAAALSPQLKAMVDEIEHLVTNATSLEALQASLLALDIPIDDMAKVMQLALSSSELMGQHEVNEGN